MLLQSKAQQICIYNYSCITRNLCAMNNPQHQHVYIYIYICLCIEAVRDTYVYAHIHTYLPA